MVLRMRETINYLFLNIAKCKYFRSRFFKGSVTLKRFRTPYLFINLSVYSRVYPSISYLPISSIYCLFIYVFIYSSTPLHPFQNTAPFCLIICLFIRLYLHPSIHSIIYSFIHYYINLFIHLFIYSYIYQLFLHFDSFNKLKQQEFKQEAKVLSSVHAIRVITTER